MNILDELVGLSHRLGEPSNDLVILAEGNSSARVNDVSFWIKASGASLACCARTDFVRVGAPQILNLLDEPELDDDGVTQGLTRAKVDGPAEARPSVESFLHAVCYQLQGVRFIGHTHPAFINMITCSSDFERALGGRLFPDEIVVCGSHPLVIPYVDPGLLLARELRTRLEDFLESHGVPPRTIYLQNHGFIALGHTPGEVIDITMMAVKAARILIGTYALGGPRFLSEEAVRRLGTRPDEVYRQRILGYHTNSDSEHQGETS